MEAHKEPRIEKAINVTESLSPVVREIQEERARQEKKWGEQNHDPFRYLAILGEEVGEANQAAVDAFIWPASEWNRDKLRDEYREELIQVAAVAQAMVECLDRGKWR